VNNSLKAAKPDKTKAIAALQSLSTKLITMPQPTALMKNLDQKKRPSTC